MIANEIRNRLSEGDWGEPGDGPISLTMSTRTLPDGMVDVSVKLGPSPRRRVARQVS